MPSVYWRTAARLFAALFVVVGSRGFFLGGGGGEEWKGAWFFMFTFTQLYRILLARSVNFEVSLLTSANTLTSCAHLVCASLVWGC